MVQNQIRINLPCLISDGMVLQRNAQVKIWGWAPPGEIITVRFVEKSYTSTSDDNGEWQVMLQTENAGGPVDMVIETGGCIDIITIRNILLGDVWICSGQSNMEMGMGSLSDTYPEEIAGADNAAIRQFLVPQKYDFEGPQTDFESGCWQAVNPQTISNFTAAGYFFAKNIFGTHQVPIGLINASLGGSPIEAWLSEEALESFPEDLESAKKMRGKNVVEALLKQDQVTMEEWTLRINENDEGMPVEGLSFFSPAYDASTWQYIKVPSYWEDEGLDPFNGVVWFRKEIEISSKFLHHPAKLLLGNVVDEDTVYINGTQVGTLPMQYLSRKYEVPEGTLKQGKNTIVVRVVNFSGKGGFYKGKPYQLVMGDEVIDLCGEWQNRIGVKSDPMPAPNFVQWRPLGLYNGMIAPMTRYAMKGILWYQGESNTGRPKEYKYFLKALIADWRGKWYQGDFPFLYVQLPNFMEASDTPVSSNWAELRESQRKTLEVPGTGMVVAIDLGEWNDIHPVNKKDVGDRLALAAQKVAYHDPFVVAFGPLLRSAKKNGNKMILSFDYIGSGLVVKGKDQLEYFAIAGPDGIFVWANAEIMDDCVVIWHEKVSDPVYVRYAWADNPEGANLYNQEGFPASPFEAECR